MNPAIDTLRETTTVTASLGALFIYYLILGIIIFGVIMGVFYLISKVFGESAARKAAITVAILTVLFDALSSRKKGH